MVVKWAGVHLRNLTTAQETSNIFVVDTSPSVLYVWYDHDFAAIHVSVLIGF